jgi:thiol-disulfide isomerase/thioredoxin
MKKIFLLLFLLIIKSYCCGQFVYGKLSQLVKQEVKLEGFNGFYTYPISSTVTDEFGNFRLQYYKTDNGMGYLTTADKKPFFIILNGEEVEIAGQTLSNLANLTIVQGQENRSLDRYAKEQPKREQALSAWTYLDKLYATDPLFSERKMALQYINVEKERIEKENTTFIADLEKSSYVRWFIPTRTLVSSVSTIVKFRQEEISTTLTRFRQLDYADQRLYKSGLLKDAIEGHFWLIENCGKPLDTVLVEMKISIDIMVDQLVKDEKKLNEVTNYLFDLLERQSLFTASEYLALKVLNQSSCTLNSDLAKQLETYRVMKKGNIAPDMNFDKASFANTTQVLEKLSDVKSQYTLVAFGASWCPKCGEEFPQIVAYYDRWKAKGVEVIFIGLEDNRKNFMDFSATFPFPSYSDLTKWDSKIASDYYVFATPTMFLLNNKREIVLRPISVKQVDAWINTFLFGK